MSRRAPRWLATEPGHVYTLHFHPPYGDPGGQVAKHYTGWAHQGRLAGRLVDHAVGRGARLTQVQRDAGGSWVLASVEDGTADREAQLKERGAARRCEVCKAVTDLQAGTISPAEALTRAGWERASLADRPLLLQIFGLGEPPEGVAPLPAPAPPEPPAPGFAQAWPEPLTGPDPEIDALVDELIAGWRTPKADAPPPPQPEPELEAGLLPLPAVISTIPPDLEAHPR